MSFKNSNLTLPTLLNITRGLNTKATKKEVFHQYAFLPYLCPVKF